MATIDFVSTLHKRTKRDYVARVTEHPKAECARVARQWGKDYWDGDRRFGYGGYRYDGRWRPVAEAIATHYGLTADMSVLDVGCGKAHLLYELTQVVPGLTVAGIDVSAYGLEHAKEELRPMLRLGSACELPFETASFDLVVSLAVLHNLYCYELDRALREIQRVGRTRRYVMVESYRNEEEKANLLYWQLTCESFYTPDEWAFWFERTGYQGDHSFIYFE